MTYRNDTDALEARLDILEKDVAERTRERDAVAHMLAEARTTDEARRWLENAPRRRRRRKLVFVAIASTIMVVGGLVTFSRLRHDARRERAEQVLHQLEQFADEACQCVDKACGEKMNNKLEQWAQEIAKHADADDKPDPEIVKRFTPVAERYGDCLMKAMSR